jgi:hypothetical protein
MPTPNVILVSKPIIFELAYLTARLLGENQEQFEGIKWQEGEANIDKHFSALACKLCEKAWPQIQEKYPEMKDISIKCKCSDINIIFTKKSQTQKAKIELKSSKKKELPGSCIGSLDINQPLIYCYRINSQFNIKYSIYHEAIVKKEVDRFQDRTPRPPVNYTSMHDPLEEMREYTEISKEAFVPYYVGCALNRLTMACNHSWQDDIVKGLMEEFIKRTSMEDLIAMKKQSLIENQSPNSKMEERSLIENQSLNPKMEEKKKIKIKIKKKIPRPKITLKLKPNTNPKSKKTKPKPKPTKEKI